MRLKSPEVRLLQGLRSKVRAAKKREEASQAEPASVEEFLRSLPEEKRERGLELKQAFDAFDKGDEADGQLDLRSLGWFMESIGSNLKKAEMLQLVEELDSNGDGTVSFVEFASQYLADEEDESAEEVAEAIFDMMDADGSGKLTMAEIKAAFASLHTGLSDDGILALVSRINPDDSGDVDRAEFMQWVTKVVTLDGAIREELPYGGKATALNDQPLGIDRFAYTPYAEALVAMLLTASPPTCVGLYAKWGSGKSFFINILKQQFDQQSFEKAAPAWPESLGDLPQDYERLQPNRRTGELRQWFEPGFEKKAAQPQAEPNAVYEERSCWSRLRYWLGKLSCEVWQVLSGVTKALFVVVSMLVATPYWVTTLELVLADTLQLVNGGRTLSMCCSRELLFVALTHCAEKLFGCVLSTCCLPPELVLSQQGEYYRKELVDGLKRLFMGTHGLVGRICCCCRYSEYDYGNVSAEPDVEVPRPPSTKEYIFVDFNAWEYAASDELWAGLIRAMYRKVEMRIAAEVPRQRTLAAGYFKRRWRAQRALQALKEQYGEFGLIRRALLLLLLLAALVTLLVLELTGVFLITELVVSAVESVGGIVGTAAAAIGALLAAVPAIGLGVRSARESGQSRGDKIFKEAKSVKDELGFLAKVKSELNELFDFLTDVFEEETGRELIIVAFVDDLDRCLKGRNVKALEAMQLILSVPGAPMIAFLAIDSRVVVASIEDTFGAVLRDAHISGWEYLDKIVQIPFSLPEPPPEKVDRLVMHTLEGAGASEQAVAERIKTFVSTLKTTLKTYFLQYAVSVSVPDGDKYKSVAADRFIELWQMNGESGGSDFYDFADALGTFAQSEARLGRKIGRREGLEIACRAINEALDPRSAFPDEGPAQPPMQPSRREEEKEAEKEHSLHVLLASTQRDQNHDSEVLTLLEAHPGAAKKRDESGRLPLHHAAGNQASEEVVEALLEAYPGAVKEKDSSGDSPLTIALRREASAESEPLIAALRREDVKATQAMVARELAYRMDALEDKPLIEQREMDVFRRMCLVLEPNPRRLKRVVQTFTLISEVAKRRPQSEKRSATVHKLLEWPDFSCKLVKWTCLCELYPYRMSLLVLILKDLEQKAAMNELVKRRESLTGLSSEAERGPDFRYERVDTESEQSQQRLLLDEATESLYISNFYNAHVERFLYSHKLNERMLRLDGDPELFQTLMLLPVPAPAQQEAGDRFVDISVADVIGTRTVRNSDARARTAEEQTGIPQRDANLALLSYSFNLNPSLRVQLASEMALLQSETELKTADGIAAIAKASASVEKKIDILSPAPSGLAQRASELALNRSNK